MNVLRMLRWVALEAEDFWHRLRGYGLDPTAPADLMIKRMTRRAELECLRRSLG